MARAQETPYYDDLDPTVIVGYENRETGVITTKKNGEGDVVEPFRAKLNGVNKKIYLGAKNAKEVLPLLEKLAEDAEDDDETDEAEEAEFQAAVTRGVAQALKNAGGTVSTTSSSGGKKRRKGDTKHIRDWLNANGHPISERGRIPKELMDLFEAANPGGGVAGTQPLFSRSAGAAMVENDDEDQDDDEEEDEDDEEQENDSDEQDDAEADENANLPQLNSVAARKILKDNGIIWDLAKKDEMMLAARKLAAKASETVSA